MMRRCVLCGDNCQLPATCCDRCRAVDPRAPDPVDQAREDAKLHGIGYIVDGKRVPPESVVAVREVKPLTFEDFWLREGPSLAWDENRERAARRIWDAARKGGV
jgi:hypothetical protein